MTMRKASPGSDGDPSEPRPRKGGTPKTSTKLPSKKPPKGEPRRATRQKAEQFQLAAPTEVGLAPTEVGRMSANKDDRVRERAYLLAEQNGFAGDPAFYWQLAERELRAHT